jgi:hypothetical protein
MRIQKFQYEKKLGEVSEREILLLHSTNEFAEGIDLSKLSEDEKKELFAVQREYETKLKPFINSAYRRFLTEKIVEGTLSEEKQ